MIGWKLVDVNGSFEKFVKRAPKQLRKRVYAANDAAREDLARRMYERAPVGPDAPHMRDFIEVRGLQVGIFDPEQAEVALYNEYRPNAQPFMRPAAMDEDRPLRQRQEKALQQFENDMSV